MRDCDIRGGCEKETFRFEAENDRFLAVPGLVRVNDGFLPEFLLFLERIRGGDGQ